MLPPFNLKQNETMEYPVKSFADAKKKPRSPAFAPRLPHTTLYLPAVAVGFRISACSAAADASTNNRLISRTACSTCSSTS